MLWALIWDLHSPFIFHGHSGIYESAPGIVGLQRIAWSAWFDSWTIEGKFASLPLYWIWWGFKWHSRVHYWIQIFCNVCNVCDCVASLQSPDQAKSSQSLGQRPAKPCVVEPEVLHLRGRLSRTRCSDVLCHNVNLGTALPVEKPAWPWCQVPDLFVPGQVGRGFYQCS